MANVKISGLIEATSMAAGDLLEIETAAGLSRRITKGNAFSPLTGDLTVDSPTFAVDATNNRVGVGRTDPLSKFHVLGTVTTEVTTIVQGANAQTATLFEARDWNANVRLSVSPAGLVLVNDTANANMTQGLTVNQGASDDEILAFKSSDVAHGVTSRTETDTYGLAKKVFPATGGLDLLGLAATGQTGYGARLLGVTADAASTTKTTAGHGQVVLDARVKSGTTEAAVGADGNLVTIESLGTTRFIFDAEGSAHADVEWIAFDDFDDVAIIESLETLLAPDLVQKQFGDVMKYDRSFFEENGLLHDVRDVGGGKRRGMLNQTKTIMLALGAIRQIAARQSAIEQKFLGD